MRTHRTFRAAIAVAAVTAVGTALAAVPAAAHVRVDEHAPPPRGGYGIVRLIAPTESATASTVGLTVTIPSGVDLLSARTLPVPGWTAAVETEPVGTGQRVRRITWRATGPGIGPAEFGEFTFSAGPWPQTDAVALPVEQIYSDGTVVAWNEVAVDTDSEPEYPAPVLALGAADPALRGDGHALPDDTPVAAAAAPTGAEDLWRAATLAALVTALATAGVLATTLRRLRHDP
ncbi:YcnI family protein [uncultured Mycolicibacterium sp.]|uniref:YcnI family copper-binding membrane protein n=1 Tax=uncultured Mycolicibacterium sp. TaxID=2320817 RepID=UPI00261BE313|nr:YcnI family protein [uncultured Mycolicibacterium sp.]